MRAKYEIKIFLVDDDALFLKSLEIDFLQNDYVNISTFATGERCIINLFNNPDLIIMDYNLDALIQLR